MIDEIGQTLKLDAFSGEFVEGCLIDAVRRESVAVAKA